MGFFYGQEKTPKHHGTSGFIISLFLKRGLCIL